jgi:TPR repeat protein
MAHLAYQYFSGDKINVNYKKGLEWTIEASKGGNHSMCFYAAMLLYTGDSTLELDCDLAVSLMVRAMKDDESLIEDGLGVLNHIYDHNLGSEKIMTFLKQYLKRN